MMAKLFDFKKKMEKIVTLNARPPKKTDFNNNILKKKNFVLSKTVLERQK